jgi:hypothetical protein
MSPTSYQAAPPRDKKLNLTIGSREQDVKVCGSGVRFDRFSGGRPLRLRLRGRFWENFRLEAERDRYDVMRRWPVHRESWAVAVNYVVVEKKPAEEVGESSAG